MIEYHHNATLTGRWNTDDSQTLNIIGSRPRGFLPCHRSALPRLSAWAGDFKLCVKPPAFQFYVDDFLGGTMHFTDAEVGLYIRLLCSQWSVGFVVDNDEELATYGKGNTPIGRVKQKFIKGKDGKLRNDRMEVERRKQIAFRKSRADNGKLGGRPRKASENLVVLDRLSEMKAKKSSPSPLPFPSSSISLKAPTKGKKALSVGQAETAKRFEEALNSQWVNDAGKWVNRIKAFDGKSERVIAEVESAIKEGRIRTTAAQYAEQIWKEFK